MSDRSNCEVSRDLRVIFSLFRNTFFRGIQGGSGFGAIPPTFVGWYGRCSNCALVRSLLFADKLDAGKQSLVLGPMDLET